MSFDKQKIIDLVKSFDYKKAMQRELNVGLNDQKIRYGVGAAALLGSLFLGDIFLLLLGSILVATGYFRFCPVMAGLHKSTVDPNEPPPTCCGGGHEH